MGIALMLHKKSRLADRARGYPMVFLAYLLLALLMTYPLIVHITTHVAGDGWDDPLMAWNLWWVPHALVDLHSNPLLSDHVFFPIGVNLTYFTLTILNALLSIPLQYAAGIALAANANLLVAFAAAGFGAYLLALEVLAAPPARRWTGSTKSVIPQLAAFLAGVVYAFAPVKMIFAHGGPLTSSQWLPFCVLYVLRVARAPHLLPQAASAAGLWGFAKGFLPGYDRRGQRDAFMAGLFLLFAGYAELTFASFLAIFIVVYLGYMFIVRRSAILTRWMAGRLAVLGLVVLAGMWPILASMLREMAVEGDYSLGVGWGFADVLVADVLGFFLPSRLHPIFGSFTRAVESRFTYRDMASVGFTVLLLAIVGVAAGRLRRASASAQAENPEALPSFWRWSTLLFAILSLGPVLRIGGKAVFDLDGLLVNVPLPFIILHYIPFIKANRYPARLQVLVVLCLAVLVAYGAQALLNRAQMAALGARVRAILRPATVTIVLLAAILFEYLAIPLPLTDMRVPEVYQRIAQDNDGAPLLQIPISWRNSYQILPRSLTQAPQSAYSNIMLQQFYQTTHGAPILSGNTSRNPEFKFTYFLEAPVIRNIVALEEGRPLSAGEIAHDQSIISEVLRFFGFKYIILYPPYAGGPLEDYVRAVFPVESIPADASLSAYRVIAPPAVNRTSIDLGASDMSNLYRAEGWGEQESIEGRLGRWTDRASARLLVPMNGPGPATMTVERYAWGTTEDTQIRLNDHPLTLPATARGWQSLTITVPPGVAHAGLNEVTFSVKKLQPLGSPEQQPLSIGWTGVQTRANIVVHSAGLDGGGDMGFAHVYVNGTDVISARRGINLAVIDPATGKAEQTAFFDLLADAANDARFLDFVKSVRNGRIIAIAVMDDASINFGDGCAAALHLIGAQANLQGRLRNGYAAIGVKGAQPGQALEQWMQGRPASVAVGAHVYGKDLGMAVSKVVVEQQ